MVGDNIAGETKPENGEGRQDFALLRDAIGENYIKGRNPVRSDDEKHIIQFVDISHLSLFEKFDSSSTVLLRFEYEIGAWSGSWHYTFHGSHRWGNSDTYSLKDLAGHAQ